MNKKYLLAFSTATLMFAACGDDVTEVTNIQQSGLAVLEKGEKLSKQACDTTNVGEMLFVMDSSEAFICDGESWQTLKGTDGADGKDGANGKDGSDGKDGEKGADGDSGKSTDSGKDGSDGKDGKDGTSCTAKSVKKDDLEGFEISCGETVIDTIWNGKDGKNGKNGENGKDGAGCTLEDDGNGSVSVTCGESEPVTWFKALCGAKSYDPQNKYCLELGEGDDKKYQLEELLTDSRDNQVYRTITIGDQVWMAENLNYNLKVLPEGETDSVQASWCGGGENGSSNEGDCSVYGRLYRWSGAMDSVAAFSDDGKGCGYKVECESSGIVRGVCPEGWHLPSNVEYETLFKYINPEFVPDLELSSYKVGNDAGLALRSKAGWTVTVDVGFSVIPGTDAYGFSALPAGYLEFRRESFSDKYNPLYFDAGGRIFFWTSSVYEIDDPDTDKDDDYYLRAAVVIELKSEARDVYIHNHSGFSLRSNYLYSVRCIKDSN